MKLAALQQHADGFIQLDIAGKVVEREINETDHKALIDEFIRNVGDAS